MIESLRELAHALDGDVTGAEVLAPGPGHTRRDRSMSVALSSTSPLGFIAHSFCGQHWPELRDHICSRLGISAGPPNRRNAPLAVRPARAPQSVDGGADSRRIADVVARIVRELKPVAGSPGEVYLRKVREIGTPAISDLLERVDAIGWHPGVYFNCPGDELHAQRLGCIVGVMTDAITARPTGAISRTYLAPDGSKLGKAKTLGSPAGIVRLSEDADVTTGLFLAEGLETALAAASIGLRPVWSTGSTGLMARFPPLAGIEAISIVADHDGERRRHGCRNPMCARLARCRKGSPHPRQPRRRRSQ